MENNLNTSKELLKQLRAPFSVEEIEWRVQSVADGNNGQRVLVLPYITSRAVCNRLDEVCGGLWQSDFEKITVGQVEAFQCKLSVKIGDEWVSRSDGAEVSDIESVKGGHSNAMKRAGVQWGIGRYLYDLEAFWMPVKQRGQHYFNGQFKIRGSKTWVKGYFDTPQLPGWALPLMPARPNQQAPQQATQQPPQERQNENAPNGQTANELKLRQMKAVNTVTKTLGMLNVPEQYVSALLDRSSGCKVPLNQANIKQLQAINDVISPVKDYVLFCTNNGLEEDRILYYGQIVVKEQLDSIFGLFFKLDRTKTNELIQMVSEDLNITQNKEHVG